MLCWQLRGELLHEQRVQKADSVQLQSWRESYKAAETRAANAEARVVPLEARLAAAETRAVDAEARLHAIQAELELQLCNTETAIQAKLQSQTTIAGAQGISPQRLEDILDRSAISLCAHVDRL